MIVIWKALNTIYTRHPISSLLVADPILIPCLRILVPLTPILGLN
jgi:hypothetical protein